MRLLITGGSGFIGSALVRHLLASTVHEVINLDALTYAANPLSLAEYEVHPRYRFVRGDIADAVVVATLLAQYRPDAVLHLAAETHVDRSLDTPLAFVRTNVMGTTTLLHAVLAYWQELSGSAKAAFRFLQVSTDEVYGDLALGAPPCAESARYQPSSPYAASKAAADHLARAWQRSYGLPVLVSTCSNNYGPCQFPEKLFPQLILRALHGLPLPLYGDGRQVRDWLHVDDHVRALLAILEYGRVGETYHVSAHDEQCNSDVADLLCDALEDMAPTRRPSGIRRYHDLRVHVADRPGHDRRYALDANRLRQECGWQPEREFVHGLRATVRWYLDHPAWWQSLLQDSLRRQGLSLEVTA